MVKTTPILIFAALFAATLSARANDVPTKRGHCVETRIAELSSRLEGAPDSGSGITYDNGIYGVSYETVPEVQNSRVGDPIRLCLVSIPKGCPAGDDRGKEYRATNLRTHQSWKLPDAEHMCGGA